MLSTRRRKTVFVAASKAWLRSLTFPNCQMSKICPPNINRLIRSLTNFIQACLHTTKTSLAITRQRHGLISGTLRNSPAPVPCAITRWLPSRPLWSQTVCHSISSIRSMLIALSKNSRKSSHLSPSGGPPALSPPNFLPMAKWIWRWRGTGAYQL